MSKPRSFGANPSTFFPKKYRSSFLQLFLTKLLSKLFFFFDPISFGKKPFVSFIAKQLLNTYVCST